jgi:hypothetical protein
MSRILHVKHCLRGLEAAPFAPGESYLFLETAKEVRSSGMPRVDEGNISPVTVKSHPVADGRQNSGAG